MPIEIFRSLHQLAGSLGEMFSEAAEYGPVNKLFARDPGGNA